MKGVYTSAHRSLPTASTAATLPYGERVQVMRKTARLAEEHAAVIVDWIVRESRYIHLKAGFEVAFLTAKSLHEATSLLSRSTGEVFPSHAGQLRPARRCPLGVVGVSV